MSMSLKFIFEIFKQSRIASTGKSLVCLILLYLSCSQDAFTLLFTNIVASCRDLSLNQELSFFWKL